MDDPSSRDRIAVIQAKETVARAIELLIAEDSFGALLQLHRTRSLLGSVPERPKQAEEHHDWRMVDPYTKQCTQCGRQRSVGVEERTISPTRM
jgi:hypothetical protein